MDLVWSFTHATASRLIEHGLWTLNRKDAEYMYQCMYVFMYDIVLLSMYTWFFKYVGHFRVTKKRF